MDSDLLHRRLCVHSRVSIRPEPFGALLYHFGTRRLSFLKDRTLLAIVQGLRGELTLDEVMREAGVPAEQRPRYARAVVALIASDMIVDAPRQEALA